jgi:hypothetical protein
VSIELTDGIELRVSIRGHGSANCENPRRGRRSAFQARDSFNDEASLAAGRTGNAFIEPIRKLTKLTAAAVRAHPLNSLAVTQIRP